MKLRPGGPADCAAIAELWFASWMSSQPERPTITRIDLAERARTELRSRWEVIVAEGDGRLLGFLALAPDENRLDQLFVAPDAQRRGIGARLLNAAKQRLADGFWLSADASNKRAMSFYEKEGLTLKRVESSGAITRMVYAFEP